jgi:NADP-dependent 3-hydroxy acid dehydrogenase YdfG
MKNLVHGIKGKVVVLTGASSEIGEAAAVMLAERGAKVVLGARELDRLQSLARRIETAGGEVAYAQTDVRKRGLDNRGFDNRGQSKNLDSL